MAKRRYTKAEHLNFERRRKAMEKNLTGEYAIEVSKRTGVTPSIVRNVRNGVTFNFTVLEALEKYAKECQDALIAEINQTTK